MALHHLPKKIGLYHFSPKVSNYYFFNPFSLLKFERLEEFYIYFIIESIEMKTNVLLVDCFSTITIP